jgi:hypothetical protein
VQRLSGISPGRFESRCGLERLRCAAGPRGDGGRALTAFLLIDAFDRVAKVKKLARVTQGG